jgi:hypothetical protein
MLKVFIANQLNFLHSIKMAICIALMKRPGPFPFSKKKLNFLHHLFQHLGGYVPAATRGVSSSIIDNYMPEGILIQ